MDTKTDRTGLNAADETKARDGGPVGPKAWKTPHVIVGTLAEAETGAAAVSEALNSVQS